SFSDLVGVGTVGLRGAALAAPASVARVRLQSHPPGRPLGADWTVQGGRGTTGAHLPRPVSQRGGRQCPPGQGGGSFPRSRDGFGLMRAAVRPRLDQADRAAKAMTTRKGKPDNVAPWEVPLSPPTMTVSAVSLAEQRTGRTTLSPAADMRPAP